MLLKALDLLRTLGWALVHFIYNLIDSLFDILKGLNAFDIINSVSGDNNFITFQKGVIAIAVTLLGLFAISRFAKKIIDPDEGLSSSGIVKEIVKCGVLIIMSTFLFVQASTFSIKLAGFTSNIFTNNNLTISDSMLTMFIDYSEGYKECDDFKGEDIAKNVSNGNFNAKEMYNDKYVTSKRFILPDKKDYKYKINWIMAVIVGGFFLYALFFSGMMLARRQIEFLFLFVISPIVFATSIGNKQRRSAVIEQLVSLTLQAAVVMLIINITALIMQSVNNTEFFNNMFQNVVIKSLMFIGCGSFLLTGSQVVNRFIGGNVSANSGREQIMSLMGFGQSLATTGRTAGLALGGASMLGVGSAVKTIGDSGNISNNVIKNVGSKLSGVGKKIQSSTNDNSSLHNFGNYLSNYGKNMESFATSRLNPKSKDGLDIPSRSSRLSRFGGNMMDRGKDSLGYAVDNIIPNRNLYRRRSRYREM